MLAEPICKYLVRGSGYRLWQVPLPDRPTSAWPGSEAKILVLTQRAADGVALFHPDDFALEEDWK